VLKQRKPQSPPAPADAPQSAPKQSCASSAPQPPPARVFAMLTDRGRRRQINQDFCAARADLGSFILCDGMGGAAAGEVASKLASQTFLECIAQQCCPQPSSIPPATSPPATSLIPPEAIVSAQPRPAHPSAPLAVPARPRTRLADAIRAANQVVFRHSRTSSSLHGMGTTLVALLWEPPTPSRPSPPIWLAHVGDSRCYRLRAGVLEQLTEDHSLVQEQVRAGVINRIQATASPMRNIITRAIGSHPTVEASIATHATQPGDLFLLASDGLTRELEDAEIAAILTRTLGPARRDDASSAPALQSALDDACHALIDAANAHGGRDNITVLLVPCL